MTHTHKHMTHTLKRQQHKISYDDLDIDTNDNVLLCFCCMKPIVLNDSGTRRMEFEDSFLNSLEIKDEYKKSIIYQNQCRMIRENKHNIVYICFICEPTVKKSISEWHNNNLASYFSKFVIETILYVQNKTFEIEKNSIWKGILCLASCVTKNDTKVYYHIIRNKDFEILEGVIAVVKYYFRKTGIDLRNSNLCLYQVCAIVRWKFSGLCTYRTYVDNDMYYYKRSFKNDELNVIIGELWPDLTNDKLDISLMTQNPNITCAACMQEYEMDEILECERRQTFASVFLYDGAQIVHKINHTVKSQCQKQIIFASNICFYTDALVFRSYTFYRHFSRVFPAEFRHSTIIDYYNYIFKIHEIGNQNS